MYIYVYIQISSALTYPSHNGVHVIEPHEPALLLPGVLGPEVPGGRLPVIDVYCESMWVSVDVIPIYHRRRGNLQAIEVSEGVRYGSYEEAYRCLGDGHVSSVISSGFLVHIHNLGSVKGHPSLLP